MNPLVCIQIVLALVSIAYGAYALRGILSRAPKCNYVIRFLEFSLLASIAGLLPPTRHLSPLQVSCVLSIYASAIVVLAWLKFRLAGNWRSVFAFLIPVVLFLNCDSLSVRWFTRFPIFSGTPEQSTLGIITHSLFAGLFALLGVLAVKNFHPESVPLPRRFPTHHRFI